jgi:hypothetical protein
MIRQNSKENFGISFSTEQTSAGFFESGGLQNKRGHYKDEKYAA